MQCDFSTSAPSVTTGQDNKGTLTADESLFMEYHERFGHLPFQQLRTLAHLHLIPKRLAKCEDIRCPGCAYGKQHRTPWRTSGKHKTLRQATEPGEVVSVDQLESTKTTGLVHQTKGKATSKRYRAATVFVDHYSDYTYVHLQESTSVEDTIKAKEAFERHAAENHVTVKHYHADNGRFADAAFREAVFASKQSISYSGVGAHHQNGKAERRIRDLTDTARTMLLHAKHRWPQAITANLWPQALLHATDVRNVIPRVLDRDSPLSLFSKVKVEPNLKDLHPFGCPVYIAEKPIQDGHKMDKWAERCHVGVYLHRSPYHASNVPLVLNTQTGLVSPQFHVIVDNRFDTVGRDKHFISKWQEVRLREQDEEEVPFDTEPAPPSNTETSSALSDYERNNIPSGLTVPWAKDDPQDHEGEESPDHPSESRNTTDGARTRRVGTLAGRREPSQHQRLHQQSKTSASSTGRPPDQDGVGEPQQEGTEQQQQQMQNSEGDTDPEGETAPHHVATTTRSGRTVKPTEKAREQQLFKGTLSAMASFGACAIDPYGLLNSIHPFATTMSFLSTKGDPDTMTLQEALAQPDREEFIKAMEKELLDHFERRHWDIIPISEVPRGHKPLVMVWSMKRKRDPAGNIIKHKARLCAHGGMQTYGVNYWETYSPVVAWSTVRTVLTISLILGWHMRSIDFVLAYPQADVKTDIYMFPPKGCSVFQQGRPPGQRVRLDDKSHRLKLRKNLYGLKDAGLTWYEHIVKGLKDVGFKQSEVDPCLFTRKRTILTMYVDNVVLFSPDLNEIDEVIKDLQKG
jgi:hypothetical protein